jgi:hypothetical protein
VLNRLLAYTGPQETRTDSSSSEEAPVMRAGSVLGSIVIVMLGMSLSASSLLAAQEALSAPPGISVIGHGEARAPADTAMLQLLIGDPNYGGPAFPQVGGTPGERERETVAPIVTALVDAGVQEDEIEVIVGLSLAEVGTYFGPAIALIVVAVDSPELEQIGELVDTATVAAADERLVVGRTSVVYAIEDCSPLEREARELAVADARHQANIMADLVGVSRGDVIGTRDLPAEPSQAAFGPYGPVGPTQASTCDSEAFATSPQAAFLLPAFDPRMEPEVTASAVLELTFAITGGIGATPAP